MKIEILDRYKMNEGFNNQAVNINITYHELQMLRQGQQVEQDMRITEFPERTIHFTIGRNAQDD